MIDVLREYSLDNNIFNKIDNYYKYQKKDEFCKDIVSDREINNQNTKNKQYSQSISNANNQARFFNPNGKDKLFWCIYAVINSEQDIYINKKNLFKLENEFRFKSIEKIRENKALLKTHKIRLSEVESNLLPSNKIQLGTVYALCLIYKKSVIIKNNKIYYDFTSNNDLEPVVIEYLRYGYCINYTKNRDKTIQDICLLLPYTGKLKSVGSYKIKELQDIALKLGIDIYHDNKKLVKSALYQRINSCIKN